MANPFYRRHWRPRIDPEFYLEALMILALAVAFLWWLL